MSLLIKMRQIKDLSPSERHIVDYIFDNLPEVINIGIVDLSKKTNTSTTTVKRLCQKLGINSYIDFRLELSMELSNYIKNSIIKGAKEPVRRYDSVADIIKKVSNQNAKSVLESTNINDSELVETIVKLMKSCRRIDWYGVGPSNVVAVDAAIKCMRLGIETSSYNNRMQMMVNAKACSCQDTMAFLVSYTGETTEILEVAHQLVMKKVPTVAITSINENALSKMCRYSLVVDATESWNRLGGMCSRIAILNLIDILFTALMNSDYDNYIKFADQTYVDNKH